MIRLTALRLFRLLVIFFAGWLLMIAVRHSPTATDVPLDAVRSFFQMPGIWLPTKINFDLSG